MNHSAFKMEKKNDTDNVGLYVHTFEDKCKSYYPNFHLMYNHSKTYLKVIALIESQITHRAYSTKQKCRRSGRKGDLHAAATIPRHESASPHGNAARVTQLEHQSMSKLEYGS